MWIYITLSLRCSIRLSQLLGLPSVYYNITVFSYKVRYLLIEVKHSFHHLPLFVGRTTLLTLLKTSHVIFPFGLTG